MAHRQRRTRGVPRIPAGICAGLGPGPGASCNSACALILWVLLLDDCIEWIGLSGPCNDVWSVLPLNGPLCQISDHWHLHDLDSKFVFRAGRLLGNVGHARAETAVGEFHRP